MKILIDARHGRDFGIGTYIRNLVRALSAIDRDNSYILVAGRANEHDFAGLPANFRLAFYNRPDSSPLDHVAFPWFVRKFGADIHHIPLNMVPLLMPAPYVVTVHDVSALVFEPRTGASGSFFAYRFRRGLQRASLVIAVSAATRRDVENLLGIPPERIRQIYNAPDPKFLAHTPGAAARAGGPDAHQFERHRILERYQINYPFLLYAGNIRPQKNIPRLVEAFAVLRGDLENHPEYADLRLIIIGDEISQYPSVRRAVIQTRMEHVVRFLGFVPFDTLRIFYEAASAFVFPSLYEGFGLPPLEAMAAGTPVVTSSVSSLPEVVGDAALTVNPENVFDIARGMREVLLDKELRARLRARGFEQLHRFSWARTAVQVLGVYREVTGR